MSNQGNPVLVRNATLFDPSTGKNGLVADVLVVDGRICRIGPDLQDIPPDAEIVEASGHYLFPSFCDVHVHFRTPGQTEKEDIESGSKAALAGGFTSVVQMPNTNPVIDTPELVRELTREKPVELKVLPAVTKGLKSVELTDLKALMDAGGVGFTDDGMPVSDESLMREALEFSREHDIPITQHAEDLTIGEQGAVRSGEVAEKLGVDGWDARREYEMVERDIRIAKRSGGILHICHVSTRQTIELIREARGRGFRITSEATPHHLVLTVDDVPGLGTNGKMNPPLGESEDREALVEALADGTIDCIATDHAPHTEIDKSKSMADAPYGVIGLETAFPVCYTELVLKGRISLDRLIDAMSIRPREIYRLERIGLFEGSRADLVLIDTEKSFRIDSSKFKSKGRNCPFDGREVRGRVVWTMYRG